VYFRRPPIIEHKFKKYLEMPKKGGKRVSVADEYDDKYEYNYEYDDHDHDQEWNV